MVKMILALPKYVDVDKFTNLVKDILRGRYGENSYYGGGLWLDFSYIIYACQNPKGELSYYEKDAEELDPVIIATIVELLQFIDGAGYGFLAGDKILPRDWWKPYPHFGTQPSVDANDEIRDDYYRILTQF